MRQLFKREWLSQRGVVVDAGGWSYLGLLRGPDGLLGPNEQGILRAVRFGVARLWPVFVVHQPPDTERVQLEKLVCRPDAIVALSWMDARSRKAFLDEAARSAKGGRS